MATKKKAKKAPAKKTKKAPAKGKSTRVKKEKVQYAADADRITSFINSMIQAGYIGKTIPEDSKVRKVAAMSMRQMAQQIDRQVHRSTT